MTRRNLTVTLEDMTQYYVTVSYQVTFENDAFGCWVDVHAVKPLSESAIALDEKRLEEIESAAAYLLVDEAQDLSSYEESRHGC